MNQTTPPATRVTNRERLAQKLAKSKTTRINNGIPKRAPKSLVPLSPHQVKLWLLNSINPKSTAYNLVSAFKLIGDLDLKAFKAALDHLESRHEILRTVFREDNEGKPIQKILPQKGAPYEVFDLRNKPDEVEAIIVSEANINFDFEAGPLWKISLIHSTDNQWIMMINVHHISFDGWSLGVFVTELLGSYNEIRQRGFITALPLDKQYADYTLWNIDRLNGDLGKRQKEFWAKYLQGYPNNLALPYDFVRSGNSDNRGATTTLVLDTELVNAFCGIGKKQGATPYNMFMSVLAILLNRYTGQNKMIFGSPVSCREVEDTQPLIGILSNTIPIAIDIDIQDDFESYLTKLHQQSSQALQNPDFPFDNIVELIQPDRSSGVNPIFQVFYAYQTQVNPGPIDGLDMLYEIRDYGTTKFDLSLDVMEGPEGPSCIFEYDTTLFDARKIAQMVGDFKSIVEAISKAPKTILKDINFASDLTNLEQFTHTKPRSIPDEYGNCFAQRFMSMVDKGPDVIALRSRGRTLTYSELDGASTRIAKTLMAQSVSNNIVAIALPRDIELIVAIVACQKIGCGFFALDSSFPADRLNYVLDNGEVQTVISSEAMLNAEELETVYKLENSQRKLVFYEDLLTTEVPSDAMDLHQHIGDIGSQNPAYAMYTSGTTGHPKGVIVSQQNWLNALYGWEGAYQLNKSVKVHLQMAHYTFDVFCGDLIRALGSGGTLVICQKEVLASPHELYQLIEQEQVQCAEFVPAVFRPLARYLEDNDKRLDTMDVLIVASDSWYQTESFGFAKLIRPDAKLVNSYGMVEATVDSTWFVVNGSRALVDSSQAEKQAVPIGQAFPNVDMLVFDENMRLCPPGVAGEIFVAGLGVVDGYINDPLLTEQKFIPHPFRDQEKIYKTGDLGFFQCDGQLVLSGRRDYQVKIRGQRIEMGDVESEIVKCKKVQQVIVDSYVSDNQKELVAYIVPVGQKCEFLVADFKQELMESMPLYMLPKSIVVTDQFPLNASGKIDRKKLANSHLNSIDEEIIYIAPRNLTEEIVTGIWHQALDKNRISITENFFSLGGHSLIALQVCSQLKKACQVDISLADIFTFPTIESLAKHINSLTKVTEELEQARVLKIIEPLQSERFKPFPMTEIQQAYWLGRGDTFEFGNISAHSYDEFQVFDINPERLESAWNNVVRQHDMLRCVVLPTGLQQILEQVEYYRMQVVDHSESDAATIASHFDSVREQMSHQIIDVGNWPNFDVRVSLLPEKKARLHFSTDAIMFDVRSFLIIMTDLVRFYMDQDKVVQIPELSFRDYVIAEQELKNDETYHRAKRYWEKKVVDMPAAPQLPLVKQPSQVKQPKFTRLHLVLAETRWSKLKKRASLAGITPTALLLAAYAEVLAYHSREPRFSLNLTFLNRKPFHPAVGDIVGEFTTLTMLAVDNNHIANGDNSFIARARKIQGDLWRDIERNDVDGIEVLRQLSRLSGDSARAKMPVVFTSALVMEVPSSDMGMDVTPVHRDGITQTSQVWLDCGVWEEQGCMLCNWDVVKEMFPENFIESAFDEYDALINRLVDDESIWSRDVTRALEVRRKDTYPHPVTPEFLGQKNDTLVSMFLDQVTKTPEAIAVVSGNKQLTYRDVANQACWIATKLQQAGGRPANPGDEVLVAVLLDKSDKQVSSTLGIMMAGAAYLPIDPALPDARIKTIMQQGKVHHVITEEKYVARITSNQLFTEDDLVVHVIDDQSSPIEAFDSTLLPRSTDLAYVIFTSGSTGKPKGVMIDHRGAVNTSLDMNQRFNISADDSVLAVSSLNFDLSVYDFFGLLAAGGKVIIPDNERRLDPKHWYQLLELHGITIWNSVPALAALLCNYLESRKARIPSMKHVFMSGDWIPLNLPNRLWNISDADLVSLGGATEASIWSIAYPIRAIDKGWQSIPYGKAMHNQRMYILDHQLEPCTDWVDGHIYIGGIGLSLGYWDDQEKTDAAFITHPVTGVSLYKTGDMGRWLPDGNIEFLGRSDFQVKVQGHRIELGEVEHCLCQLDEVEEAVVSVVGERENGKSLIAYILTNAGNLLDDKTKTKFIQCCRSSLKATLPTYMVPRQFIVIDELPLTANGKVDRNKLNCLNQLQDEQSEVEYVAPETPIQQQLVDIWKSVLKLEKVGINDNFFKLGGDSMKALEMMVQINDSTESQINLGTVLAFENIEKLAEQLITQEQKN
jgi:amino acid adenylation domain-containing protein